MKTMAVTAASAIAVVVLLDLPTSSWYLQAPPFHTFAAHAVHAFAMASVSASVTWFVCAVSISVLDALWPRRGCACHRAKSLLRRFQCGHLIGA